MWIEIIDQSNNRLSLTSPPQRIVSCVPSITQTLLECGLEQKIVGRTKFCKHPVDRINKIQVIGGTKSLHIEKIKTLNPDLIIANKEENTKSEILTLMESHPVYVSNIRNLEDLMVFLRDMGRLFGNKLNLLARKIQEIQSCGKHDWKAYSVAYLIWRNPYMTVGRGTFIDHMLTLAGFENVFVDKTRYPETDKEELILRNPEFIFLSSEPYPFKEKHITELNVLNIKSRIILVDGTMFSWYGVKTLSAFKYFEELRQTINEF